MIVKGLKSKGPSMSLETDLLGTSLNAFFEIWYLGVYDNLNPGTGGVIIDAGANVGDFTIRASNWVGDSGTVVAIEPIPEHVTILKRNLTRNRISNVVVVERAVGDREEVVEIEGRKVRTVSMDGLLDDLKISRVDSVKLDVEGAEGLALRGGRRMVRQARHFSVETHSDELYGEVASTLTSEGFAVRQFSISSLVKRMAIRFLNNPAPFLFAERARIRAWDSTGGPIAWKVAKWLSYRRKPDWFSEQSGLILLAADRDLT